MKLNKKSFLIPLSEDIKKKEPPQPKKEKVIVPKTPKKQKVKKVKKTRKLQSKKSLDKRDKLAVKIYCNLTDTKNAQYYAYIQAFPDKKFNGSVEDFQKEIDNFFNNEMVKNAIDRYRDNKHIIQEQITHAYPSKLTEANTKIIETGIQRGMSLRSACTLIDVTPITFMKWLKRGKIDIAQHNFNSVHAKFYYRLHRASAVGEASLLDCIYNASKEGISETKVKVDSFGDMETITTTKKSWQAAAWILERTRKATYGRYPIIEDNDEDTNVQEQAKQTFDALQLLIATTQTPD